MSEQDLSRALDRAREAAEAARQSCDATHTALEGAEAEVRTAEEAFAEVESDPNWKHIAHTREVWDRAKLSAANADHKLAEAEARALDAEVLYREARFTRDGSEASREAWRTRIAPHLVTLVRSELQRRTALAEICKAVQVQQVLSNKAAGTKETSQARLEVQAQRDGRFPGFSEKRPETHITGGTVVAYTAHALAVALQGQEYAPEVRQVFGGLDAVSAVFTLRCASSRTPMQCRPPSSTTWRQRLTGRPPNVVAALDVGPGPDVGVQDLSPGVEAA